MAEFKFFCPQCGRQIQCDTGYAGTQINCPACQQAIVVPQAAAVAPPPPSMAAPVPAPAKSPAQRNALVIAAAVVVLAGLGWFGYSMLTRNRLPTGLVGLWSGEGSGKNSAASGTAILTDVFFAEGKVGQAFSFNQPTSAIKISARRALNVGAGPGFTIYGMGQSIGSFPTERNL
jgi:DNA-directed RNA polymerase subunit RPC12/RpoP